MTLMNMFTHKNKSTYLYATPEAEPRGILSIKKEVEDFIFTDGESVIDSISLKKSINTFTDYVNAKCCLNKCYSFNNSDYKIQLGL